MCIVVQAVNKKKGLSPLISFYWWKCVGIDPTHNGITATHSFVVNVFKSFCIYVGNGPRAVPLDLMLRNMDNSKLTSSIC